MPVLHKYRENNAHYVLTSIKRKIVTFQLTSEGYVLLKEAGVVPGEPFNRFLLQDLYRMGHAFTGHTGAEIIPGQGMLDFSDDQEPETVFPSCSLCDSQEDLHLVQLMEKEPSASILCNVCRAKERSLIDTSIPLPFVTRVLLKRFLDMRKIVKIDKSVSAYQESLNLEFSEKWKELTEKKAKKLVQETLIDSKGLGTLV